VFEELMIFSIMALLFIYVIYPPLIKNPIRRINMDELDYSSRNAFFRVEQYNFIKKIFDFVFPVQLAFLFSIYVFFLVLQKLLISELKRWMSM
jgi:hypothetical protein